MLRGSIGAGCDGFLPVQVQGGRAELEAAVASLTDAAGVEKLLAWHWDLLVAAAGTEHVTAIPAEKHRRVTAGAPRPRATVSVRLLCTRPSRCATGSALHTWETELA